MLCGLHGCLAFYRNPIPGSHTFSLLGLLKLFYTSPLSESPCWFHGKIQPFRPCCNWDRVEVFWASSMYHDSLNFQSHTFFWIPFYLMSSSTNLLNNYFPSGDISVLPLLYCCSTWQLTSKYHFSNDT